MEIKKNILLDIVNQCVSIINKKSPIFEMKNIKLQNKDNLLLASASDIDNFINVSGECINTENSIDTCVNGCILQSIIKTLKEDIKLYIENNHLIIDDGIGIFKIKCFSSKSFPDNKDILPFITNIDGLSLNNILKSVNINITDEDCGICRMICKNNMLSVVVNDRKRLSFTEMTLESVDFDMILSAKAMQGIMKSITNDCAITGDGTKFMFKTSNLFIVTRSVNTRYLIDHNRFLNIDDYLQVDILVKDFTNAIKRSLLMAQVINKIVHLKFSKNQLEVCGVDISVGNSTCSFTIDNPNDDNIIVAVNGTFLLDVLNCISGKKINILFKSSFQPLLINDIANNTTHVLMPIKVGI